MMTSALLYGGLLGLSLRLCSSRVRCGNTAYQIPQLMASCKAAKTSFSHAVNRRAKSFVA